MHRPRGLPCRIPWRRAAIGLLFAALALPVAAQKDGEEAGGKPAAGDQAATESAGDRPALRLVPLGNQADDEPGPIRVVANIIFDLPGLDLTTLTPRQKERFLQRVNTEYCTCGRRNCVNDPVAHCYINDPGCDHAKMQAKMILYEVKAGK